MVRHGKETVKEQGQSHVWSGEEDQLEMFIQENGIIRKEGLGSYKKFSTCE